MAKHNKKLENYQGTSEKLATELGDLTYDSLAIFLEQLSAKLEKDGEADFNRGRLKLAKSLRDASKNIEEASKSIETAWQICETYMKK